MAAASTVAPLGYMLSIIVVVALLSYASRARARGRDYRRILAEGRPSTASVVSIGATRRSGRCWVGIEYATGDSGRTIRISQRTTPEAIRRLGVVVGASLEIKYLPKSPKAAFAPSLVIAEQQPPRTGPLIDQSCPALVNFVAFTAPASKSMAVRAFTNAFRWFGPGLACIIGRDLRFVAQQARWFRPAKEVTREFALDQVVNVEAHGNAVRLEFLAAGEPARQVTFWTVNPSEASAIAGALPSTKTSSFTAAMAEASEFRDRLAALTPTTFVTNILIAINVAAFIASLALGAGLFAEHPQVLVRLGSNFTTLTRGGEWWRLLTSTFLHFGLVHIGFNMWALAVNGPLAERLYGSTRYLLIYLLAGLAGSIASLWWHPIVNGAGASGAIFGVFGALLAFFLRRHSGVPLSVIKAHRTSISIFIAYALLNGARVKGIDNAAHLGGLASGLVLGLLLGRPIDVARNVVRERRSTVALVLAVYVGVAIALVLTPPRPLRRALSGSADATANPPPLTEPKFVSEFAGVRLGETRAVVERNKGHALKVEGYAWLFNSRGPGDNGLIEVVFNQPGLDPADTVVAIFYQGDYASVPAGLTYMIGATRESLVEEFHEPVWTFTPRPDEEYAMFEDGETVRLWQGRAISYGIQNFYQTASR